MIGMITGRKLSESETAMLGETAAAVLSRMRQDPEAEFHPVSRRDDRGARRLVSLGLAAQVRSRQSDLFGLPFPVYLLTGAGRHLP